MNNWVKTKRLSFKFGSLEWMNFFGLPTGLILLSIINVIFIFKTINTDKLIIFLGGLIGCFIVGVYTYFLQLSRLKFKTFKLTGELDDFKNKIRDGLNTSDWKIDYDNNQFLQATNCGSLINLVSSQV